MKEYKCPKCGGVFLENGKFCNKCSVEELQFRAEQDALEGQARAEAEAEDRGRYEAEQAANEQAEYEQSHVSEEQGPEG